MSILEPLFTLPIFQALGWTLIHFIWQGTLAALFLGIASICFQGSRATVRYGLSCVVLLLMFVLPLSTLWSLYPSTSSGWDPGASGFAIAVEPGMVRPVDSGSEEVAVLSWNSPWGVWRERVYEVLVVSRPWFILLWSLGVFCLSLRLAGGWVYAQRLRKRNVEPASQQLRSILVRLAQRVGVKQRVELLRSSLATIPTVLGWLRPVILLPTSALTGLSPAHLEAILLHELAHIRRLDYLVNLLQTIVETLLFYHPAAWWVSRQIRIERENCCDDVAVGILGGSWDYATALTRMEELRAETGVLAIAASGGSLLDRIRRLVVPSPTRPSSTSWVGVTLALAVLAIVGVTLHAALPANPSESEEKTISSERKLDPQFEQYMLSLRQTDMGDWEARRQVAEDFIRNNPDHPRIGGVYVQVLQSLSFSDPATAIELADRLLADPNTDPRYRSHFYTAKFRSYKTMGDTEAATQLARHVLANEDDYSIIHTAASYDEENALAYIEKALERAEEAGASGQFRGLLHGWYGHYLAKEGRHEEAVQNALRVIELTEERLQKAETGEGRVIHTPKFIRGELASSHLAAADYFAETQDPERGIPHLAKSEELDREASLVDPGGRGDRVETIRGRILERLGRTEKALDSYINSYAAKMDTKVLEKIEGLSQQTGISLLESLRRVDQKRASGPPFKPFELQTLDGETRKLSDYNAEVLLITFFFPRCGPCSDEAVYLESLYRKYKDQGLEIVALNTNPEQTREVAKWQAEGRYTFPILVGATREFLKSNYNFPPRPGRYAAHLLLNQQRKTVFRHMMERPAQEGALESEVRELLGLNQGREDVLIAEIRFEGNTVFTDEELVRALQLVKIGQFYVPEKLEYDVQVNLLDEYRDQGYVFAKAGKAELVAVAGEETVGRPHRLTIPIQEGSQYRYGSFELEGAKALAVDSLLEIFAITPGEVVSYPTLKASNEELKRTYCRQGYLDMEPIPEMKPDHESYEVGVRIHLEEGRQYILGQLSLLVDPPQFLEDDLRPSLPLLEGEVFNCDLLDLSVLRLKRYFRMVEYDMVKHPETGRVDVTMNLANPFGTG